MSGRIAGQGSKWIRQDKRLAIYLRDGLACAYCGATPDSMADRSDVLSLDHLVPCSQGGGNHEGNLVTCCQTCNSRRQDMDLSAWLQIICGDDAAKTARFIATHTALDLRPYRAEAKRIIARRNAA